MLSVDGMGRGDACPGCLARSMLLGELAAFIDCAVHKGAGSRARDLLALGDEALAAAVTPDAATAARALGGARAAASHAALTGELERSGTRSVCVHSAGWPAEAMLRLGSAAPRALLYRGDGSLLDHEAGPRAVTVVGARRCSAYGREVARRLGAELAAAGIVVVSGMAFGIDTAAHEGALEAGGATVAILAAGAERAYPRSAHRLYGEIVGAGAVVSELPPGSPTFRWAFPARNRIMAALAEITVIVEAADRSGSLITAEMAADCGRAVGAVPGPVSSWRSSGANRLLADGARLVRDGADVLEELLGPGAVERRERVGPALGAAEEEVLDLLERGERTADALIAAGSLGAGEVAVALGRLELAGYLRRDPGGAYARTALARR